jgi:hypothetical protein
MNQMFQSIWNPFKRRRAGALRTISELRDPVIAIARIGGLKQPFEKTAFARKTD